MELAIVLVIIGLLVGGILIGQDMIRQAAMRRMVSYAHQIESATQTFRTKYNGIPGDINNATTLWGTHAACGAIAYATAPTTGTCNGNGDGFIMPKSTPIFAYNEPGAFWEQLAYAGLIEGGQGSFNGYSAGWWPNTSSGGPNGSPSSDVANNAYWSVLYYDATGFAYTSFRPGHWLWLTGYTSAFPQDCGYNNVMTVAEMKSVEEKFDDGKPASGNIAVPNSNFTTGGWGCYTGSSQTCLAQTAGVFNFNSAATNRACAPIFRMGF